MQWLQYQLDELYDLRRGFAHGAIAFVELDARGPIYHLEHVVQSEKRAWGRRSIQVGSGFLADICTTAEHLARYFHNLRMKIRGEYSWEKIYKDQCQISESNIYLRELVELNIVAADDFLLEWLGTET